MTNGNVSRWGSDHGHRGVRLKRYLHAMKHRYPVILLVALFLPACFGQTPFEHADQRTFSVGYMNCVDFVDGFAVSGWATDDNMSSSTGFIRGFDMSGTPLWEHVPQTEFAQLADPAMAGFSDGTFLCAGGLFDCDFFLPYFLAERIDVAGGVLWSRTFPFTFVNDAAINAGDSVAYLTDLGILLTNGQGDSLTSFGTDGGYAIDIAWEDGPALLVGHYNGAVTRWSCTGSLLAQTAIPDHIVDLLCMQGHRFALTNDGWLRSLAEDLQTLDSLFLGTASSNRKLLPLNGDLLIAGNDTSFIVDMSLAQTGAVAMDPDDEFPTELFTGSAQRNGYICMSASAYTGNRSAGLVRTVALDGTYAPHPENVNITLLNIDSAYFYLQNGLLCPQADVTVRITNLSSAVLDKLTVCHFGYTGFICGSIGTTVQIEGAGLATGDVLDVPMTGLHLPCAPEGSANPDPLLCISALSPNDLYDRDPSDNYTCDTVHLALSIRDPGADGWGLHITNPFTGAVELRFTSPTQEPLRATLLDATGRQFATTTIAAGSMRFQWEPPGLSDGVHILQLEGRSSSNTRKLIHQQP